MQVVMVIMYSLRIWARFDAIKKSPVRLTAKVLKDGRTAPKRSFNDTFHSYYNITK